MSAGYFANLRPSERRLVVIVGVVFFVVINFWFVFPKFGDWDRVHAKRWEVEQLLNDYKKEVAQIPKYTSIVKQMEREGQSVPADEQSVQFSRTIQTQQAQSGVTVTSTSKMQTQTNQFFVEQSQTIAFQAQEPQLVEFLHSLGTGNFIRVKGLTLRPDPSRQRLTGNVTLTASYQKKKTEAKNPAAGTGKHAGETAKADTPASSIPTAKRQ